MEKKVKKELDAIYEAIGKLPRTTFNEKYSGFYSDHEYIDTCLIYKMLQKRRASSSTL